MNSLFNIYVSRYQIFEINGQIKVSMRKMHIHHLIFGISGGEKIVSPMAILVDALLLTSHRSVSNKNTFNDHKN